MKRTEIIFLILIILLGSLLRLILLGIIPFGVTHDELGYIFNAYSIAHTGKNVFGQTLPFLTWMSPGGFPFLPVPIYLAAPIYWFLPLSPTTGRLMGALLGISDILLVFLLTKQLLKKILIALLSALMLAISPWHIHFSRTAYDPNYSLFFYLLGITVFIFEIRKKRLPIFSLIAFLLAIFSYRGMSIFGIPLFFVLFGFAKIAFKATTKQLSVFGIGIGIILLLLGATIHIYGKAYTAEGEMLFTSSKIAEAVNTQSRDAQGPLWIKRIYLNKPLIIAENFTNNYLQTFSPGFLFLNGEGNSIYSMWTEGKLYLLDIFFIIAGFIAIFSINRPIGFFLIALLLLGALPGGIGGQPYSARDLFMSVIFSIFTACGIWWCFKIKFVKRFSFLAGVLLGILYLFSLGYYLFNYYEVYAYQAGESWAKSLKDVSNLIIKKQNQYQKIIIGPVSHGDFIQFALYDHLSPQTVQMVWEKSGKNYQGPFVYKNINFTATCPSYDKGQKSALILTIGKCYNFLAPSYIVRDYWGNPIWREYTFQ